MNVKHTLTFQIEYLLKFEKILFDPRTNNLSFYRNITQEELESVYSEMVYYWFTYHFNNIDLPGLIDPFLSIYTPEHRIHFSCINLKNTRERKINLVKQCIPLLHIPFIDFIELKIVDKYCSFPYSKLEYKHYKKLNLTKSS